MLLRLALFIALFLLQTTSIYGQCSGLPPHGISPLFSFGHAILSKNQWAASEELLFLKAKQNPTLLSLLQIFYGINDICTIIGNIPIINEKPTTKQNCTALGDCYLNLYSRLFQNKTKHYDYRVIGVVGMRFPTATGALGETLYTLKTTSFFLGVTHDALTNDWYLYSDLGALLFTKKNSLQFGHLITINIGIGRTLCLKDHYLSTFLELSDYYSRPDRFHNRLLLNTGGNILFIGPTVRFAHKGLLAQVGIQWNVAEHLRNRCDTIKYIAGGFIAYTF